MQELTKTGEGGWFCCEKTTTTTTLEALRRDLAILLAVRSLEQINMDVMMNPPPHQEKAAS